MHGAFKRKSSLCLTSSAAALLLITTPGYAQTGGAEAGDQGGLEDIVVTARKRAETLQDVPVAVTAFSEAQIRKYDFSSLERVAASTPNFTIARASNGSAAQLTLRGIGSNFTSIGIEQSVATVVDGAYYGQGRIINEGLFDLGRLEILKGPQALFFGKNATAGVISITTADPGSEPEYIGRVGYEFAAEQIYGEIVASGPVTDTLGVRVAVKASKMFGGYVKNVAGPVNFASFDVATGNVTNFNVPAAGTGPREKEILARITLKWEPTEQFTAKLKASLSHNRNNNASWNYVLFDCSAAQPPFVAGSPCGRRFRTAQNGIPVEIAANFPYYPKDGGLANRYDSYGATLDLNYVADNFVVTSVTNYQNNDNEFALDADYFSSNVTNLFSSEKDKYHAFSNELRVNTTFDSPVNLLFGGYYQKTKLRINNFVNLGGVEDSTQSPLNRYMAFTKDSGTRGETVAAFGQVSWKVVPQVELNAGVRYTHETKKSDFVMPYVNSALSGVFLQGNGFTRNQTFKNWSPEFTVAYQPTTNVNIYGSYKTGYKSGGFSNTGIATPAGSQDDFAFQPERVKGFEGGIKTTLLDRQLRLELALYNYKFSDPQIDFFNSSSIAFVTTNAGSARTKGVEFSAQYAPHAVQGLNVRGSLNYNKARYIDYIAPCYQGALTPECVNTPPGQFPTQNLAGKPTSNAPKWTASLGADYEVPLSDSLNLLLTADTRYSSSYLVTGFYNPIDVQPKYFNIDASARIRTSDERWEFAVIGRNLTNKFVINGAFDAAGTGGPGVPATQIGLASLPRTVQAQVTFRY